MEKGGWKRALAFFKGKKGVGMVCALAALAVLFLVLGGRAESGSGGNGDDYGKSAEAYRETMEARVTALCRQVKGVDHVTVVLVLASGDEYVYAVDDTASGGTDTVVAGGAGLLVLRRAPAVSGIAVVCGGGGDPAVQAEISRLLHAAFGVPYSRICVSEAKS